jgi:hypothetical protein
MRASARAHACAGGRAGVGGGAAAAGRRRARRARRAARRGEARGGGGRPRGRTAAPPGAALEAEPPGPPAHLRGAVARDASRSPNGDHDRSSGRGKSGLVRCGATIGGGEFDARRQPRPTLQSRAAGQRKPDLARHATRAPPAPGHAASVAPLSAPERLSPAWRRGRCRDGDAGRHDGPATPAAPPSRLPGRAGAPIGGWHRARRCGGARRGRGRGAPCVRERARARPAATRGRAWPARGVARRRARLPQPGPARLSRRRRGQQPPTPGRGVPARVRAPLRGASPAPAPEPARRQPPR